jgi:hypothetical protein
MTDFGGHLSGSPQKSTGLPQKQDSEKMLERRKALANPQTLLRSH